MTVYEHSNTHYQTYPQSYMNIFEILVKAFNKGGDTAVCFINNHMQGNEIK